MEDKGGPGTGWGRHFRAFMMSAPVDADLLEAEGWYAESPNSKVASDQLAAAENTPASLGALLGNFVGIRDVITIAIEDILVNDLDVATRLAQANEEANKSLTEYEQLYGN